MRDSLGAVFHLIDSRHQVTPTDEMVSTHVTYRCNGHDHSFLDYYYRHFWIFLNFILLDLYDALIFVSLCSVILFCFVLLYSFNEGNLD